MMMPALGNPMDRGGVLRSATSSNPLSSILLFIPHLQDISDDRQLLESIIQAAAIWYDLDVRAYRRDLTGRFLLAAWLPGADPTTMPRELPGSATRPPYGAARMTSIAEFAQLGWGNPDGELLVVPVVADEQPTWLLAVVGSVGEDVESALTVMSRTVGTSLAQFGTRRARQLQKQLVDCLGRPAESVDELAAAALAVLAAAVGAESARLVSHTDDAGPSHVLASSGPAVGATPAGLAAGASLLEPARLAFGLTGGDGRSVLEVHARATEAFSLSQAELMLAAIPVVDAWLAGTVGQHRGRLPAGDQVSWPSDFESRIRDEIVSARRMSRPGGLLVIDPTEALRHSDISSAKLVDRVRRIFRDTDVIGRLRAGDIAILLANTTPAGLAAAAERVRELLLESVWRPPAAPPHVTFATFADVAAETSVSALIARARQSSGGGGH